MVDGGEDELRRAALRPGDDVDAARVAIQPLGDRLRQQEDGAKQRDPRDAAAVMLKRRMQRATADRGERRG